MKARLAKLRFTRLAGSLAAFATLITDNIGKWAEVLAFQG
jgi:hypothetical protein